MVAVARIMNATLVIPKLDKRSFWHDSSIFSDNFDEERFMKTLEGDVHKIKELPKELESVPKARKHFTTWSGVRYYEDMAHLWEKIVLCSRTSLSFVKFILWYYTCCSQTEQSDL